EERPRLQRGDMRRYWLAVENKWMATRYGQEGMYIRTPSGKRRQLRQEVTDLVQRLGPIAQETGDAPFLTVVQRLEHFESGAAWQRNRYREVGDWKMVIGEMKSRFMRELDAV